MYVIGFFFSFIVLLPRFFLNCIRPGDTVYTDVLLCQIDGVLQFHTVIGHFLLLGQQVPDATFSLITLAGRAFSPLFISGKIRR